MEAHLSRIAKSMQVHAMRDFGNVAFLKNASRSKWAALWGGLFVQHRHSGARISKNPESRDSGFDASHRPGMAAEPSDRRIPG
jgi:hypothetical protein